MRDETRSCREDYYTQDLLSFITFWILFFCVIAFKFFQDRKDTLLKRKLPNHNDFTILVKNVKESNCEEDFKKFLEKNILIDRKVEIFSVNRVFKIQEYYDLAQEKIELVNERENLKKQQLHQSEKCKDEYRKQKESLIHSQDSDQNLEKQKLLSKQKQKARLDQINKVFNDKKMENEDRLNINMKRMAILERKYIEYTSSDIRTGMVFVTFNKFEDCQAAKDKYFKPGFQNNLKYKKRMLKFRAAYEPLDIIWENLETPVRFKLFRRFIFLSLALMLTLGSLVAVSAVTQWQKSILEEKYKKDQSKKFTDDIGSYALSLFCTIIISIINSILTVTLTIFSKHEKHNTFTSMNVSVSMRLSWIQFINTALVPFVILLILTPPEQKDDLIDSHGQEYLRYVIQNIFFIFIGNAIFVPIITLYEPEYIWKKIRRWWVLRKRNSCRKTQSQLNEIFEDPEFLIQEYYAVVNRIILSGFFYATMLSLGILIKCVTMFFLYWAFKKTFIHHSAYPKCLSNELNSQIQQIMFFIPAIFVSGNLIYRKIFLQCKNSDLFTTYNIIAICFGASLIIFHSIFVNFFERFNRKKTKFESYPYEKNVLGLSYEQTNPISKAFSPENRQHQLHISKDIFNSDIAVGQQSILSHYPQIQNQIRKENMSFNIPEENKNNSINKQQKNINIFHSEDADTSQNENIKAHDFNSLVRHSKSSPSSDVNNQTSNASASIIDYAFTNILLKRERENQIISAAFERKKTIVRHKQSLDLENSGKDKLDEEDDDDDEVEGQELQKKDGNKSEHDKNSFL